MGRCALAATGLQARCWWVRAGPLYCYSAGFAGWHRGCCSCRGLSGGVARYQQHWQLPQPPNHPLFYKFKPENTLQVAACLCALQKTDIWSCGVALFVMLTNQYPFRWAVKLKTTMRTTERLCQPKLHCLLLRCQVGKVAPLRLSAAGVPRMTGWHSISGCRPCCSECCKATMRSRPAASSGAAAHAGRECICRLPVWCPDAIGGSLADEHGCCVSAAGCTELATCSKQHRARTR